MKNQKNFRIRIPKNKRKKKLNYKKYSSRCKFRFDITNFPQEFDLSLVEKYGWFSQDNPNGVTRDHMLSISYGWKKDVSPTILSHPANCRLMFYENNLEKGWRSSINLNDLLKKINEWDKKYKYLHR